MSKVTKKPDPKAKGKKGKNSKNAKQDKPTQEEPKENEETVGFGKFEFQNKIIYIGAYRKLKTGQKVREGYGKVIHPSMTNSTCGQEYYEGEWKNDKMNGYGIYHYSNGDIYEGEWLNNLQHGVGKYFFTDGYRYEGDWWEHKMHGFGKYLDTNNLGWGGEFRDGCFFSKEQAKWKEEKRILKKIAKIKELPYQFFRAWEDTYSKVDKKNVNDMLSPFFGKTETMGMYLKNVSYPNYEDYKPEYWNSALRWAFGQPEYVPKKPVVKAPAKNKSQDKKKAGTSKDPATNPKEKKENIVINITAETKNDPVDDRPKPKIEFNVPQNGNELKFWSKDSLLTAQLQDEVSSGQVIEMWSTMDERVVELAIGFNRDLNGWLIIYYKDNQAPEKEKPKAKPKPKSKAKSKPKGKK